MDIEPRRLLGRVVACTVVAVASVGMLAGSAAAKAKPTCTSVSPATINGALGTDVAKPEKVTNGTVSLCTYKPASGTATVLIRFESGLSKASFAGVQKSFDTNGQPTQTLSGLGDAAFTSTLSAGSITTNTVVMLKGSNSVLISAGAPLDKVEGLAKIVLKKL